MTDNDVDETLWNDHCQWLRRVHAMHREKNMKVGKPAPLGPSEWKDDPVFRGECTEGDDVSILPPMIVRQNGCWDLLGDSIGYAP